MRVVISGYRYYFPEIGRWLSRDPRGEAGSLNLYLFVYNKPLYFIDPFGLNPIESFIVSLSGVLDKSLNAAIDTLGWNDPALATRLQSGVEWQLESSGLYTLDESIAAVFETLYIASIGTEAAAGVLLLSGPQGVITGAGGVFLLADASDKFQELFTGRNMFKEWVNEMPITDQEKQIILCAKEISVVIIEGAGFASQLPKSITNPIPERMARVVPAEYANGSRLAAPNASEAWVTAADDLAGINTSQGLAQRLTLVDESGNLIPGSRAVIEFDAPASGIASPINRSTPGFVGRGQTAGGAREFVIPNMGTDQLKHVTIRIVE